jgi:hypothetical protein
MGSAAAGKGKGEAEGMAEEAEGLVEGRVTGEEMVDRTPAQISNRAVEGKGVIIEAPLIGGMLYAATAM